MPSTVELVALAATALGLSAVAPFVLLPVLRARGVLDVPNLRSSHVHVTPRGGGLGVGVGYLAAVVLWWCTAPASPAGASGSTALGVWVVGLAAASWLLGGLEDLRGVGAVERLGLQLGFGVVFGVLVARTGGTSWLWVPVVAVATCLYTNVANFMDGVNGISAGHGLVVGAAYTWVGATGGEPLIEVLGLVLAAAFAGFLPWNAVSARLFLGDSGSYLLGGAVAATAVAALVVGVRPELVVSPLVVYLADVVATLVVRTRRRERLLEPHRSHVYQRLLSHRVTHLGSASLVAGLSAVSFLVTAATPDGSARVLGDLAVCCLVVGYLVSPLVLARRPMSPGRLP